MNEAEQAQPSPQEIATEIHQKSDEELVNMELIDRFSALEGLGMLAHEELVGCPERSLEEWQHDEVSAVVKLFKGWPSTQDFSEQLPLLQERVSELVATGMKANPNVSRKEKMEMAVKAFSQGCREILEFEDFPDIDLVYKPGPSPGYFAGADLQNKVIQVCSRNILQGSVTGSGFQGDMSFIELVLHESTHMLQNFMAEKSDKTTLDEKTNQLCARQFYEATDAMRKLNHDVYWQHPFERQAREVATDTVERVQQALSEGIAR